MTTAKALVIFNIGVVMALAYVFEATRLGWSMGCGTLLDILGFVVAWAALIGIPIAGVWGLATWKRARFWPALVVHPIVLVLWPFAKLFKTSISRAVKRTATVGRMAD